MPTYLLDLTESPPASFGKYGIFDSEIMWKACWMHVHFILRIDFMCLRCVYFVKNCYLLKLQCYLLPFICCDNARFVSKIERNFCVAALDWQQAVHRKWMWFNFKPFSHLFFLFASISHFSNLFALSFSSLLT